MTLSDVLAVVLLSLLILFGFIAGILVVVDDSMV